MSKSDRELLELAAKAYFGNEIDDVVSVNWCDSDECIEFAHADNQDHNGNDVWVLWNPLTDDGDALRLAVKLGLAVIPFPIYREHKIGVTAKLYRNSAAVYRGRAENIEFDEEYGFDAAAATRRAIVRAAAAIGETMQ